MSVGPAAQPFLQSGSTRDDGGNTRVQLECMNPTYRYASLDNVLPATPTNVLTITGSASKVIRIRRFMLSGKSGTAGTLSLLVKRQSTADTSGTSTAPTGLPMDINDAAATAGLLLYTANPTVGTVTGTIMVRRLFFNLVTAGPTDRAEYIADLCSDKSIILRGTTDILAFNFGGAALPGASVTLDIDIEWTEENT